MRRKNWRVVIVGFVLVVLAVAFYFFMLSKASKSTDPVALMRDVESDQPYEIRFGGSGRTIC